MKIIEMTDKELKDAISYMRKVPKEDPCYSGWNFDPDCWKDKLKELQDEKKNRGKK